MNTITRVTAGTLALLALSTAPAFALSALEGPGGPSVSVTALSPGATVAIGTEVSFNITASGFSSALSYVVHDTSSPTSISNANINSSGVFTWIPTASDVNTHTLTITAADQSGHSASVTQTITVPTPPAVSIQSLSPGGAVNPGMTIFFNAPGTGFTNPTYAVTDSALNSSLQVGAINSAGGFSWTPKAVDAGSHTITVIVTDGLGNRATATVGIVVNGLASASIQSLAPGTTTTPGQAISFNIMPVNFTNPVYTVSDSFSGSSVGNWSVNASSGKFSWTPTSGDIGTHLITVRISDSRGSSAVLSQQVVVQNASLTIPVAPTSTVAVGTPVAFSVTPTGFTKPSYTVGDSLSGTTVSNADITAAGNFTWTPAVRDAGMHSITVYASDASGHTANVSVPITVNATGPSAAAPGTLNALQAQLAQLQAQMAAAKSSGSTSSTASKYVFSKFIGLGSTGIDVTELQKRLTALGIYSGPITGYFGNLSQVAVKQFQKAHGIAQVGYVGPGTRAALNQ